MVNQVKMGLAVLALLIVAYFLGYSRAATKGALALEELNRTNAEAVIEAQQKIKEDYDGTVKALNSDLARANELNRKRLRELTAFRRADRDLETCRRERGELAELAVEGEYLLREADSYFNAITK